MVLLISGSDAFAQTAMRQSVDSVQLAYYDWCNTHQTDRQMLQKADTLRMLAERDNNVRMQAVAYCLQADYFFFNNRLDSLKYYVDRAKAFARSNNELTHYYFAWNRLITSYIRADHSELAEYELRAYLKEASQDNFPRAVAHAYQQMGQIYSFRAQNELAIECYCKCVEYVKQNQLDDYNLAFVYARLVCVYAEERRFDLAMEADKLAREPVSSPRTEAHILFSEAQLYAYMEQPEKARERMAELFTKYPTLVSTEERTETELLILRAEKNYAEALQRLNTYISDLERRMQTSGGLSYRYKKMLVYRTFLLAAMNRYHDAYNEFLNYWHICRDDDLQGYKELYNEFASLIDYHRLDQEKAESERMLGEERSRRLRIMAFASWLVAVIVILFGLVLMNRNRQLEKAKRAAEEANRMKALFIRTITHEINTPLNAIVGFSELATTVPPPPEEEMLSYIRTVRENSGYLQKLVDDVLYISDIESSEQPVKYSQFEVNAFCRSCIERLRDENELPKGSEFVFEPGDTDLCLNSSPLFLGKAIRELMHNAVRFSHGQPVTLSYEVENSAVHFFVSDQGPGIPPENVERIFDRFIKLNYFSQGLGLGLSVVRLIATTLGGSVRVDTSYTQGARFILTIPR